MRYSDGTCVSVKFLPALPLTTHCLSVTASGQVKFRRPHFSGALSPRYIELVGCGRMKTSDSRQDSLRSRLPEIEPQPQPQPQPGYLIRLRGPTGWGSMRRVDERMSGGACAMI